MQDANVQHIIADLRSVDLPDSPARPPPAGRHGRLRTRGGSCTLAAGSGRTLQPSTSPGRGSRGSDGVQHLSPVDQRVFGLQEVRETVELLETGIGVMLAMRGMTWHLDRDDVLGHVPAIICAERDLGDPGAEERASRLVLAPARQLAVGKQPFVLRGLLGADVDEDDVKLAHDTIMNR
jgi:hypothetical protein